MKYILSLYSILLSAVVYAQPRTCTRINDNWQFTQATAELHSNAAQWQPVSLPHTWNKDDVMDDAPGYYRGAAWYKRKLVVDKTHHGKQVFLFFEGVNQVADVFINGKKAGHHTGGYSGFYVPITDFIKPGENEVLVKADNSHDNNIPPLSADFTFYGGIYRDAWLVATDPVHFSFMDRGSKGVYITTPLVNASSATVQVKTILANENRIARKIKLTAVIRNKEGKPVHRSSIPVVLSPGRDSTVTFPAIHIKQPRHWSPESPYLYTITTETRDAATGKLLDAVTNPLGFRWFQFDAAKGFFLNGKSYKLVGTSRHQDFKGMGNAVPDAVAKNDILLLKKMGGNFLRVAHYPQDPAVLEACDSLGILASVEIPIVNEITESDTFYNNCRDMQVEMIRQHYNQPSVIMWCSMNEVLLRPHFNNDKERQKIYFAAVTKLAKELDSLTRKEDPYRYTMIAHHGDYNRYRETGLVDIPMVVGWNLYSGWYGASITDFPVFLDAFHKDYPNKPMLVSEYGADADPRIRSTEPTRFDKSVEYTTKFHQYYMAEMMKRPFVAAAMIWNLADFNSETRTESMPHINNKGLLEWDRSPKDPYYYYKAILTKQPFIKILGTTSAAGIADSIGNACHRSVQVASNVQDIELFINGKSAGKKKVENGLSEWNIAFVNGQNTIEAKAVQQGKTYSDKESIQFYLQPYKLDTRAAFRQVNILLGARRYFTDDDQQIWIPGQEYREGSWGHIGGKAFKMAGNGRLPYGTDKNINNTDNDPLYQTQQIGIKKYKLDVPDGNYELTLHFAELLGGRVKELVYNLSGNDRIEPNGKRVFDVHVNGALMLDHFDITSQYGPATAVIKTIKVKATGGDGIEIDFTAIEGEAVLNALQVKKMEDNTTSK